MISLKPTEKNKMDNNIIKTLYKQIRDGCSRKVCYNKYCHHNLICNQSKQKIMLI